MAENWFQEDLDREPPTTVAELASNVLYRAHGCPDVTIRRALANAYGEFCRRSSCLRHFNVYGFGGKVPVYPVMPWCGGRVDSVQRVLTDFSVLRENEDYKVQDGNVVTVRLVGAWVNASDGSRKIRVEFVEMPLQGSESAPRWFLDTYGDAIVSGALAEIHAMQNMPWYRPEMAIAEGRAFQDAIGTAKMRGLSGANAGSGRMIAPDFSTIIV